MELDDVYYVIKPHLYFNGRGSMEIDFLTHLSIRLIQKVRFPLAPKETVLSINGNLSAEHPGLQLMSL